MGAKVKATTVKKVVMGEIAEESVKVEMKEEVVKTFKAVSEDTKRQILASDELQSFVGRNYKFIERVRVLF